MIMIILAVTAAVATLIVVRIVTAKDELNHTKYYLGARCRFAEYHGDQP